MTDDDLTPIDVKEFNKLWEDWALYQNIKLCWPKIWSEIDANTFNYIPDRMKLEIEQIFYNKMGWTNECLD